MERDQREKCEYNCPNSPKNRLVRVPLPEEGLIHAWYKFNCFINMNNIKDDWGREKIIKAIRSLGLPAFQGSCSELYLEMFFK